MSLLERVAIGLLTVIEVVGYVFGIAGGESLTPAAALQYHEV